MHDTGPTESETRLPVRYVIWPAQSLRCSLFAVQYRKELLVKSQWVTDVYKTLDTGLRTDIALLNEIGVLNELMTEQYMSQLTMLSVPEFIAWIDSLPVDYSIWHVDKTMQVPAFDPDGPWYRLLDPHEDASAHRLARPLEARIVHLCSSPVDLKELTVTASRAFWSRFLADEFHRLVPTLERAIALGARDPAPKSKRELCIDLVGREPMGQVPPHLYSGDILAVPVCHLGAFPLSHHFDEPRRTSVYVFEAERMPAMAESSHMARASTYRALADEKRLEIIRMLSENPMYGAQLSKRIGLSQPTVSKHLRILAAEGILKLQQDGLIKRYSIDPKRLEEIARSVEDLKETE